MTALARHPQHEEKPVAKAAAVARSSALTTYRVKSGDTWSSLSRKYECSVTALATLNGVKPSQTLKAGQALKIPAGAQSPSPSKVPAKRGKDNTSTATATSSKKSPSNAQQKSVRYLVRQGDTLSSIAGKFHVPLKTLCAQNKVRPNQKLAPGNILTICTSQSYSAQSAKKKVN